MDTIALHQAHHQQLVLLVHTILLLEVNPRMHVCHAHLESIVRQKVFPHQQDLVKQDSIVYWGHKALYRLTESKETLVLLVITVHKGQRIRLAAPLELSHPVSNQPAVINAQLVTTVPPIVHHLFFVRLDRIVQLAARAALNICVLWEHTTMSQELMI